MMSLKKARNEVGTLRQRIAPDDKQQIIAASDADEAEAIAARLGPNESALIVITGVPRGSPSN